MLGALGPLGVAQIGCGAIAAKRLRAIQASGMGQVELLYDSDEKKAIETARKFSGQPILTVADAFRSPRVGFVIVSTPNSFLATYGSMALEAGKHLLLEKPGAISIGQVLSLVTAQRKQRTQSLCKIGFNLRFHPAAMKIRELLKNRELGPVLWVRGAYGHGGRPGYELEWRFQKRLSGGGEVIDQGVHLFDLLGWLTGERFELVQGMRQNAFYRGTEEDNGFLWLQSGRGTVASFHFSATQWKNLFRLEINTARALLVWEGLGDDNYGPESLTVHRRRDSGGAPETTQQIFPTVDSWRAEWEHFFKCAVGGEAPLSSPLDELVGHFTILERFHALEVSDAGRPWTE